MATLHVILTFFSANSSGWLGNNSFFTLVKLEIQVKKLNLKLIRILFSKTNLRYKYQPTETHN